MLFVHPYSYFPLLLLILYHITFFSLLSSSSHTSKYVDVYISKCLYFYGLKIYFHIWKLSYNHYSFLKILLLLPIYVAKTGFSMILQFFYFNASVYCTITKNCCCFVKVNYMIYIQVMLNCCTTSSDRLDI